MTNKTPSVAYQSGTPVFLARISLYDVCGIVEGKVISVGREFLHINVPDTVYTEKQNAEGLKNTFRKIKVPLILGLFTEKEATSYLMRIANTRSWSLPTYIVYGATKVEVRARYVLLMAARKRAMEAMARVEAVVSKSKPVQTKEVDRLLSWSTHQDLIAARMASEARQEHYRDLQEVDRLRDVIERAHRALNNGQCDEACTILSSASR